MLDLLIIFVKILIMSLIGNIEITQEQKEILFGTLLGDGNLRYNDSGKSVFGRMNHSASQEEYIKYKQSNLANLTSNVKSYKAKAGLKYYDSLYFTFKSNIQLNSLYHVFYDVNGKKHIPDDLSLLTPRAMAFWFMDDGTASNPTIKIATCCFSMSDLLRLQTFLSEQYGIDTVITGERKLYFKAKTKKIFKTLVDPYIIESMRYKLKFIK